MQRWCWEKARVLSTVHLAEICQPPKAASVRHASYFRSGLLCRGREIHIKSPKDAGPLPVIMAVTECKGDWTHCVSIHHNRALVGQDPFHSGSRSDTLRATYFIIISQIHISTTYVATLRILPILRISISTLQTREETDRRGGKGKGGMKRHNSAWRKLWKFWLRFNRWASVRWATADTLYRGNGHWDGLP